MTGQKIYVVQELGDAQRLALAYAPAKLRRAYRGVLLLDAQLSRISLTSREPALAQLKLAWWRDACANLVGSRGHPVLQTLTESWLGRSGVLTGLIDAWEELAAGEGGFSAAAGLLADARAAAFAVAADEALNDVLRAAARRWTIVELANHAPSADERATMLGAASDIGPVNLRRALRPLAVLDGLAKRTLRRGGGVLLGDRLSPLAAVRLGIFGR